MVNGTKLQMLGLRKNCVVARLMGAGKRHIYLAMDQILAVRAGALR